MAPGIGPFEGMHDEVTGEVTVYCDAESHQHGRWEQTFTRRGDGPWIPNPFEQVGDDVRTPRRGGGIEFINAAGRVVKFWDTGRNITDPRSGAALTAEVERARRVAGTGADAHLPLGLRYQIRCPECTDTVRRAEPTLRNHFNFLWAQGFPPISLTALRKLKKLI